MPLVDLTLCLLLISISINHLWLFYFSNQFIEAIYWVPKDSLWDRFSISLEINIQPIKHSSHALILSIMILDIQNAIYTHWAITI